MDELEFRRKVFADPKGECDETAAPKRAALINELNKMDEQIQRAIKVPVASDLADRILMQNQMHQHHQQKQRHQWQLAIAVTLAFVIGLSFTFWPSAQVNLGEHALNHVSHEYSFLQTQQAGAETLERVNLKLARFDGQFDQLPGELAFANFCDFDGILSLHLLLDTDQGRINLFLIPPNNAHQLPKQFADQDRRGMGQAMVNINMALVAPSNHDEKELEQLMQQVKSHYSSL